MSAGIFNLLHGNQRSHGETLATLGCVAFSLVLQGCGTQSQDAQAEQGYLRTVSSYQLSASRAQDLSFTSQLTITPVNCENGEVLSDLPARTVKVQSENMVLAPEVLGLRDLVPDPQSRHRFADHLQVLDPGCYNVEAVALLPDGSIDSSCHAARRSNLQVEAGKTKETLLLHQCESESIGMLDMLLVRNHAPQITNFAFDKSKFVTCAQRQVACVHAQDPDGDPLRFEWSQVGASPSLLPPAKPVLRDVTPEGAQVECVEFLPDAVGRYDLHVDVFDLARRGDELVKMQFLTEEGIESKAGLDFLMYSQPEDSELPGELAGNLAAAAQQAETKKHGVLILATSVQGGVNSRESLAAQKVLGIGPEDVDVVDESFFRQLSPQEFAGYRAIVLGDPNCGTSIAASLDAAIKPPRFWSKEVTGNVLILGSNPSFHKQDKVIEEAIRFAAGDPEKTGAYISTSCYYRHAPGNTRVSLLDDFLQQGVPNPNPFLVVNPGDCANQIQVATNDSRLGWDDGMLSNWSCSAQNFFESWPENFEPVAFALDFGGPTTTPQGNPGLVFALARGITPFGCGNGIIEHTESCDDGNLVNGDGCDRSCNTEECGDGWLTGTEACDDGNQIDGDGCSKDCLIEPSPCTGTSTF